jgi:hypothetical protein
VSTELLAEVGPSIPGIADRRRSVRQLSSAPAWLSDASGVASTQQQVTVTNLSLHGVGFVASKPVEEDEQRWIVIATDRLHLSTRLRVVSVRQRPEGGYEVGGEFF